MALDKVNKVFLQEIEQIKQQGRYKGTERIIKAYIPPKANKGERFLIKGYNNKEFIRMNTNSYMALSNDNRLISAADKATDKFGVGPGAVRFIDGTYNYHIKLEKRIAKFIDQPSAKIFNSAYTSNLALALTLASKDTYWIGDELNHNSIIRGMKIASIPRENRAIFKHNNMADLQNKLEQIPSEKFNRVCIIFDGIFSMRGDHAPMKEIKKLADKYHHKFQQGVITIVDDSHGIGAYGKTARGTQEYTNTQADITVGTFGKAFGVNGGFIVASDELIELIRQKADTYIYTNPLSVADCASAIQAINIIDSKEGIKKLTHIQTLTQKFRDEIEEFGYESINGPHAIVPILIRDTQKVKDFVETLFQNGVLVVGLTYPVVPQGSETIRVQINAGLTSTDITQVLDIITDKLPSTKT